MRMRVEDNRRSRNRRLLVGGSSSNGIKAHAEGGALSIQSPREQQRSFLTDRIAAQVQQVKHRAVAVNSGHQRGQSRITNVVGSQVEISQSIVHLQRSEETKNEEKKKGRVV